MTSKVRADEQLYCLSEEGTMSLVKPASDRFELTGRFRLADAKPRDAWAHPVVTGGRLYLRYHDALWCYDVERDIRRGPRNAFDSVSTSNPNRKPSTRRHPTPTGKGEDHDF